MRRFVIVGVFLFICILPRHIRAFEYPVHHYGKQFFRGLPGFEDRFGYRHESDGLTTLRCSATWR